MASAGVPKLLHNLSEMHALPQRFIARWVLLLNSCAELALHTLECLRWRVNRGTVKHLFQVHYRKTTEKEGSASR